MYTVTDYPRTIFSVSDLGVCRCDAYRFPHSVGGGKCVVCPSCSMDGTECNCCRRSQARSMRWYWLVRRRVIKSQ